MTEIWGHPVEPKVGSYVKPDGWSYGDCLIAGDEFSPFRIPAGSIVIESLAVRIEVTGRTLQLHKGRLSVRVKVVFVGDGEPDTVCGGFMAV
jgi:hypothetical protein